MFWDTRAPVAAQFCDMLGGGGLTRGAQCVQSLSLCVRPGELMPLCLDVPTLGNV